MEGPSAHEAVVTAGLHVHWLSDFILLREFFQSVRLGLLIQLACMSLIWTLSLGRTPGIRRSAGFFRMPAFNKKKV